MANIINLNAEVGANYIGDDAQPALRIENSSTGPGISVDKLLTTSQATVAALNVAQLALVSGATISSLTLAQGILAGNATVGMAIAIPTPSVASGAAIKLSGQAFVSAISLVFAASANWAGMGAIRVVRSDGTFGWIPVLPSAVVTAAAVE